MHLRVTKEQQQQQRHSRVIRKYTDANVAYSALCQAAERDHSLYILFSAQVAGAPLVTLV